MDPIIARVYSLADAIPQGLDAWEQQRCNHRSTSIWLLRACEIQGILVQFRASAIEALRPTVFDYLSLESRVASPVVH